MDEYISREEAIKALYEVYEHDYPTANGDFDEYARHDVRNVLNELPSANVQPVKHGRWIVTKTERGWNCAEYPVEWTCSECKVANDRKDGFCPHCGARMDGDSE